MYFDDNQNLDYLRNVTFFCDDAEIYGPVGWFRCFRSVSSCQKVAARLGGGRSANREKQLERTTKICIQAIRCFFFLLSGVSFRTILRNLVY